MQRVKSFAWNLLAACVSAAPFVVLIILLLSTGPKFRALYESLGSDPPQITLMVLNVSDAARSIWPLTIGLVILAWLATFQWMLHGRSKSGRTMAWCFPVIAVVLIVILMISALSIPMFGPTVMVQ